jgi:hypothetical protein
MIFKHNKGISLFEISYWTMISSMVFNYFYVKQYGEFVLDIPKKYRLILVFRAIVGYWGAGGNWGSM